MATTNAVEQRSAAERAQNELFYEIDESGGVLKFEVPPWLAAQIAKAYGKPELAVLLLAQIEAANLELARLDPNQAFDHADAIVQALNGELHEQVAQPDPRHMVFGTPVPYAAHH